MLNQAQIIGHVGKQPEVRYMPSGEAVANFSIATTEKWKDKSTGEAKEATEWHRISVFGKLAEIVQQYVVKGSLVYISGKIKTRKYTDKDGVEKYTTEITADSLKMLGGRPQGGEQSDDRAQAAPRQAPQRQPAAMEPRQAPARPAPNFNDMDDDIPF